VKRVAWKDYYREELVRPSVRTCLADRLAEAPNGRLLDAFARGAVVSFPHTRLDAAGPIDAEVVASLYRTGIKRIFALGVLHSGAIPAYSVALDESAADVERTEAFRVVEGTFAVDANSAGLETPFGLQPVAVPDETAGILRVDRAGLLRDEFSLDTFLAILRLGSDVLGRPPIPVEPLFVGMTRHAVTGAFDVARSTAHWLRARLSPATAVVATGDLVHFGSGYGIPSGFPIADGGGLERRLRIEVSETLSLALRDGDLEGAYRRSKDVLRNDQREILPVIAEFLGRASRFEIVRFDVTDYADLLEVSRPCVVASALVVYG